MSTMPKGDRIRKAVRYISDERVVDECRNLPELIAEACYRFNLSPIEENFLYEFYCDSGDAG